LVDEIGCAERLLESNRGFINDSGAPVRVDHVVFGSRAPGAFNLGGDLELFLRAIIRQDRAAIESYAIACIDNIHRRHIGFGANIATIALVQGKAMGGGFECALASDVIIAERSATFCLPEALFNLFPGMGAFSFLARKVGVRKAEEICTSAETYSAQDMFDAGVVDELAEDGAGLESTRRLIVQRQKRGNSARAFRAAKRHFQPVTHAELRAIVDVWVDAAFNLETRDLRMMARLVRAQDKLAPDTGRNYVVDEPMSSRRSAANG
jgi:DSF synthase